METAVLVRRESTAAATLGGKGVGRNGRRMRHIFVWITLISLASLLFFLTRPTGSFNEIMLTSRLRLESKDQQVKQTTLKDEDQMSEDLLNPTSRGFLVMTSGCKIPDLDPMDPAVRKFVKFYAIEAANKNQSIEEEDSEKIPPNCAQKVGPALVESNLTSLYIVHSSLGYYNVSEFGDISCCYVPFRRISADPEKYDYSADNKIEFDETCNPFAKDGTAFVREEEFVRVECRHSYDNSSVPAFYKDFHAFTPISVAWKRAKQKKNETKPSPVTISIPEKRWSVLIIGVDAVSRLNFHRQMPKTKKTLEDMGAVEFLAYNKVADNTFPNVVPLMSGLSEEELKNLCWPNPRTKLDDCPWLWQKFATQGYLTGIGEDCAWMSTFNYVKVGFLRQPTHFYFRPFSKVSEDEAGHSKRMNAKVCVGPRLTVQNVYNYIGKIVETVSSTPDPTPFFGLFWSNSLTHDFLNSAGYGDEPQSQLLRRLAATGALNHTLLFFLSDHGIRWGGIRETYQGRLEERLPFVFVVIPPAMRNYYPSAIANLVRNARKRLTTPFDIHATLKDILHADSTMSAEAVAKRTKELTVVNSTLPRGISLFLPVPESRTCIDAGITPNWCGCHAGEQAIKTDDPMALSAARVVVKTVNVYLKPYPQCATRTLVTVRSAIVSCPPETLLPSPQSKTLQDVAVVLVSHPGAATFEATVRVVPKETDGKTSLEMAVAGTISRINRYGNQSACVDEFHMKLYCYCGSS